MKKLAAIIFLIVVLLQYGCKKDDNSSEVTADFTYEITVNPGEVSFTNKSSNAVSYEWNFGDGKFSTLKDPIHIYNQNDTYFVKLTAFGNEMNASKRDTLIIDNLK